MSRKEQGVEFEVVVGTMIEIPRAALTADEVAEFAQFFLIWDQRLDPDNLWILTRRCRGQVSP